ncbi:thioesterase superfamily protein [Artemisia annua]|uniref:Thioesterase superfamily protein n=1 Tax=Artemisia annua TaxID=35608 RepID=A0A2U1NGG3_ARTAN|nr:thioesterase superfamily protein [Artemisia annua]
MKKGDYTKLAKIWLENNSKFELDGLALKGMKIDRVELGYIRCYFVIPDHLSDANGNWNAGAMSVLIDDMAAGAVFSITGGNLATVDFTMSFYSTVKVNEEVEIEASVVGEKGNLVSVVIDIKKKGSGEKVVVGKQWMQATPLKRPHLSQSKL